MRSLMEERWRSRRQDSVGFEEDDGAQCSCGGEMKLSERKASSGVRTRCDAVRVAKVLPVWPERRAGRRPVSRKTPTARTFQVVRCTKGEVSRLRRGSERAEEVEVVEAASEDMAVLAYACRSCQGGLANERRVRSARSSTPLSWAELSTWEGQLEWGGDGGFGGRDGGSAPGAIALVEMGKGGRNGREG